MITYGSVCSGIEAASVAWEPLGWKPAFFSEIESFPRAVLAHRWPGVTCHGDFTTIGAGDYEPIDLLVGGTPCQSFSVAGLRGGLADRRGNLTLEFLKLADRLKPEWIVWENVPGILSDGDNAFALFLDGIEELGYIADVDIHDAQFHGLAQRRRRVFVCAQRADALMNEKTLSSALTISQCLAEISLLTLLALSNRSVTDSLDLAFDVSKPHHSLLRRMRLFGLQQAEAASMLVASLEGFQASSDCGQDDLDSACGKNGVEALKTSEAIEWLRLNAETEAWREECLSIEPSWNEFLAAASRILNESTTSTSENEITEKTIFICAQTLLHMAAHINQSMACSPPFWSAASSISTALEAFISYARQASSDLFTDAQWVRPWVHFLGQAERASQSFRDFRVRNFGQILPLTEGLRGDSAPGREKGQRPAPTVARGSPGGGRTYGLCADTVEGLIASTIRTKEGRGCERGDGQDNLIAFGGNNTAGPIDIATAVNAHGGPHGRLDFESETFIAQQLYSIMPQNSGRDYKARPVDVAQPIMAGGSVGGNQGGDIVVTRSLRGDGFDASEDGTGRGTPLVPILGFQSSQSGMRQVETHATLDANNGSRRHNGAIVGPAVRRLTPRECCRLQGFPDDYLDITYRGKPAADGNRYKALGNSFAVPVVRWIGRRIHQQEMEIRASETVA